MKYVLASILSRISLRMILQLLEIMRISQHQPVLDVSLSDTRPPMNALSRTLRLSTSSMRLDISPASERSMQKILDRTTAWRQLILAAERRRLRKAQQDQYALSILRSEYVMLMGF